MCGFLLHDHHTPIEAFFEDPGTAYVFLNFLHHGYAALKPVANPPPLRSRIGSIRYYHETHQGPAIAARPVDVSPLFAMCP